MPDYQPIAKFSDVPEGRGITRLVAGRNVALFKLSGEIFALDGVCPHKGGPLGEGICDGGNVFCPLHGWQFEIRTGACVDFPNKTAATFPARVVGEMIEVAL